MYNAIYAGTNASDARNPINRDFPVIGDPVANVASGIICHLSRNNICLLLCLKSIPDILLGIVPKRLNSFLRFIQPRLHGIFYPIIDGTLGFVPEFFHPTDGFIDSIYFLFCRYNISLGLSLEALSDKGDYLIPHIYDTIIPSMTRSVDTLYWIV